MNLKRNVLRVVLVAFILASLLLVLPGTGGQMTRSEQGSTEMTGISDNIGVELASPAVIFAICPGSTSGSSCGGA